MLGKKKRFIAYPVTFLCGAAIVAFLIVGRPQPESRILAPSPVPMVEYLNISESEQPLSVGSQGVVSATTRIELVAEVSGRVISKAPVFAPGGEFSAEEVLLEVDQTDYLSALSQAKANVADAERLLAVEQGTARQAKREWRELHSEEANALFLRKPQIASAKANLEAARAALAKAETDLQRTQIQVPFDGRVLRQDVDEGEYIVAGRGIGEVFASGAAEIRLPLSTAQFYRLGNPVGAVVVVSAKSGEIEHQWQGKVIRVESSVDAISRMHHVVASIDNAFESGLESPALALGQFVEAQIQTLEKHRVFEIPRAALRQPQDIWLLDNENALHVVGVDVVQRDDHHALVRFKSDQKSQRELNAVGFDPEKPLRIVTSSLALAYSGMQTSVQQ